MADDSSKVPSKSTGREGALYHRHPPTAQSHILVLPTNHSKATSPARPKRVTVHEDTDSSGDEETELLPSLEPGRRSSGAHQQHAQHPAGGITHHKPLQQQQHHHHHADDEDVVRIVADRAIWLVGLLLMQSLSSFILARNEKLLQEHLVIVRFLTMLVGAGGNAGNQASVRGETDELDVSYTLACPI